ncbi:MAG: IPT/TIG domain-containing protein [Planctomycetes bacterium]|nr:IPT/TIG domain-containing protein [Planctomycetota bacterium]
MRRISCLLFSSVLLAVVSGCGNGGTNPSIGMTSITPSNGVVTGGTAVTIKGFGYSAPAQVTFDGVSAASINVVDAGTITCNTPAGSGSGWVDVVLTIGTDTVTRSNFFYYYTNPTISSLDVTEGPSSGYTDVTITGTGFLAGASVTFGGLDALEVTVAGDTSITCKTPAYPAGGAVDVAVSNTDGGSVTSAGAFLYRLPPTITSVSPSYADVVGGATITIDGTDFYGNTSNTIVTLDTTNITPASVTATQVTFVVPGTFTEGTYDLTFTNPDTQTGSMAHALFLYASGNLVYVNHATGSDSTGLGTVGSPYQTIGKGISMASAGQTVLVQNGTYDTESFPVALSAGVNVVGESVSGVGVVGGGAPAAVFQAVSVTGSATALKRLSVIGADADTGVGVAIGGSENIELASLDIYGQSRGVEVSSSEISMDSCRVRLNLGRGGMKILSSDVTATRCEFSDNTEENISGGGAGVYVDPDSTISFGLCTFVDNDATAGSADRPGGGMYVQGLGEIVNCMFSSNTASVGGGLITYNVPDVDVTNEPQLFIRNCIFYGNHAQNLGNPNTDGAAVAVVSEGADNTGTVLVNCVFADNTSSTQGASILCYAAFVDKKARPYIRNCIITGANANGYWGNNNSARPVFQYNCFYNNVLNHMNVAGLTYNTEWQVNTGYYSTPPLVQGVWNIVQDPGFLDAGVNNYRLAADSACIDAGDPDAAYNDTDASTNDMGAYGGPDGDWQ